MPVRRTVAGAVLAVLVTSACGGADDPSADPSPSDPRDTDAAVVEVIDDTVTVEADDLAPSLLATGDTVAEGDTLRTDATGFAQLDHADGSLSRIGPETVVTLQRLRSTPERPDVDIGLDVGRTFHVVGELAGGGRFQVTTSVAVAAVRGTTFAVTCLPATTCTVIVVDGAVTVTLPDDTELVVDAGEQVVVTADGAGDPEPAQADPWVDDNLALGPQPPDDGDGDADGPLSATPPPPPGSAWPLATLVDVTGLDGWVLLDEGDDPSTCDDAPASPGTSTTCSWLLDRPPWVVGLRVHWAIPSTEQEIHELMDRRDCGEGEQVAAAAPPQGGPQSHHVRATVCEYVVSTTGLVYWIATARGTQLVDGWLLDASVMVTYSDGRTRDAAVADGLALQGTVVELLRRGAEGVAAPA